MNFLGEKYLKIFNYFHKDLDMKTVDLVIKFAGDINKYSIM